jgi:hypothetical protein
MSALEIERTLARLYTDESFRRAFLGDPQRTLHGLDLTPQERGALAGLDRAGLVMAAASYRRKQAGRSSARRGPRARFLRWARGLIRRL